MPSNKNNCSCNIQENKNLCSPEKVCIQTKRVFDACISQFADEGRILPINIGDTSPVQFLSCVSTTPAVISDVIITPIDSSPCSRVQYTITVPLLVKFINQNGCIITYTTCVTYHQDIILKVPCDAIIPAEIQATVKIVGKNANIVNGHLVIDLCVTIITKVIADVDLIILSYGYPKIAPCTPFAEEVCDGVFNQPIYPIV